jgi:hypothetical protein
MRRILLDPGPRGHFKVWIGEEGGSDRIIFLTRQRQFYFSTRWFGYRLRVWSVRPYVWVGRA